MTAMRGTKGQPLVALAIVLGGWVAVRAALLNLPAFVPASLPNLDLPRLLAASGYYGSTAGRTAAFEDAPAEGASAGQQVTPWWRAIAEMLNRRMAQPVSGAHAAEYPVRLVLAPARPAQPGNVRIMFARSIHGDEDVPVHLAAGHQMLLMAALAQVPLDMVSLTAPGDSSGAPFHPVGHEAPRPRRWSADGWVLLRRGGNVSLATGSAPATYGASQAGAVLRYSLAPDSDYKPAAYLRATAALNGSREKEAALGLSARPLPSVPVVASVELRATDQAGETRLRPAAMLVTQLAPFRLPLNTRGEAYVQAGYVGGRFSTPFVDGQLHVDKGVAQLGKGEVRAGAGAWGGAQKGASRLDVGPAATMGLGIGDSASARVSVDWRFRVAGNAQPSSGPALTLSAGF